MLAVLCACGCSQGTSRGGANIKEIVRRIDLWGLDMVFVIGGNGGNAAANAIQQEVERQGVRCVVAGVPKSIDNDILLVSADVAGHVLPHLRSSSHLVL
jgi:6-phosphofructokinase 1